jgi:membrane protease YdiL (CAAX protease family)
MKLNRSTNSLDRSAALKAALVLCGISAFEGAFIVIYPSVWVSAAFLRAADVNVFAWLLCAAVTIGFIAYSIATVPLLARLVSRVSLFKLLAPVIAVPSAILEEVFFRSTLMDALAAGHCSIAVQIAGSALAFGAVHAAWGIRGGWRAVRGAVQSTTLLGLGLACVYLAAGRIVFPCVVAHFTINMVLEPWLMYAYTLRARQRAAA